MFTRRAFAVGVLALSLAATLSAQATQTKEELARAGQHSTDGAVIAETAVLDFLYA